MSAELPRTFRTMDEDGRITIPKKYRAALGIPEGKEWPIMVEAYPDLENTKCLIIKALGLK